MIVFKLFKIFLVILMAIVLVAFLWQKPLWLIGTLLILAYLKHRLIPIKIELLWFIISGFIGSVGESIVMIAGPWSYAKTQFINFPLWLPFLWGVAGITAVSLYLTLTEKAHGK